ncbi:hypothetical protein D3C87_1679140 [compost metagenome]
MHGHHGQHATGGAPDRPANRLGGVHGPGGHFLRDHHAHRPALRRWATAGCAAGRTGRHRLRCGGDAVLRDGVLVAAESIDRSVPRSQRSGVPRSHQPGRELAGGGGMVRVVRRHANHRHGLHSRTQGRQDHVPGWLGLLLADWRTGGVVDGVPLELGADGCLVGVGAGAGVRGGEPDAGV